MRGLTIPRPVHVASIEHMGKEVIVDPTDTPEELTAEQLSATDPVIYRDAHKTYDALRARVRAAAISRAAREAQVSRFKRQGVRESRDGPAPFDDREDRGRPPTPQHVATRGRPTGDVAAKPCAEAAFEITA